MNKRLVEILAIVIVVLGGVLAIYLKKTPVKAVKSASEIEQGAPKEVEEVPAQTKAKTFEQPKTTPSFVTFSVPVAVTHPLQIGFLGESRGDIANGEAFNEQTLRQIFEVFKKRPVEAVFFTGNLVAGLTDGQAAVDASQSDKVLKAQLEDFSKLYDDVLGAKVPLFPIMGDHEMAVPQGTAVFRDHFHLENGVAFDDHTFAYTVAMGDVLFAVIPSHGDMASNAVDHTFSPSMLLWLKQVLSQASQTYRYLFVVGHEPAFSLTATFFVPRTQGHTEFWNILVDNGVLAYFASHEHFFDRSKRQGVWQVVSGGGGALFKAGAVRKPFFHCLVLTIPQTEDKAPKVQVIDVHGHVGDEFELTPSPPLLYQRHISGV